MLDLINEGQDIAQNPDKYNKMIEKVSGDQEAIYVLRPGQHQTQN